MRILVLGGTQFLGRHVVETALGADHDVTLFNRGQTRPELFPEVESCAATETASLDTLAGRSVRRGRRHERLVPRIVRETSTPSAKLATTPSSRRSRSTQTPRPADQELAGRRARRSRPRSGGRITETEGAVRRRRARAVPGCVRRSARADRRPIEADRPVHVLAGALAEGGQVLAPAPADGDTQVIDARDLAAGSSRRPRPASRARTTRSAP